MIQHLGSTALHVFTLSWTEGRVPQGWTVSPGLNKGKNEAKGLT